MNRKINILVTASGSGGVGEQILKALKLANDVHGRYQLIAGDMGKETSQRQYADKFVQTLPATDPDFINNIFDICDKESVDVVFYGCEPELKIYSQYQDDFAKKNIFLPISSPIVIDTCLNKTKTGKALSSLGFAPPRYVEILSKNNLEDIDFFPVIVKPASGGGGSSHCYIAQDAAELELLCDYLGRALPQQRLIVQEYVGDETSEYTVGVLMDMDGNYMNAIAMNRYFSGQLNIRAKYLNMTGRTDLGKNLIISSGVSHGRIAKFEEITSKCRQIAESLGARGAINIQLRYVDGVPKVFEINPRFSGTTSLRAMMGYNEPDILICKHIYKEEVKPDFEYQEGVILRRLKEEVLIDE